MKLIDKFNNILLKVGVDKILHLLVGFSLTLVTLLTAYMVSGELDILVNSDLSIGGFLLVISVIKEQIDNTADYYDILYAMGGWAVVSAYFWLLFLIF